VGRRLQRREAWRGGCSRTGHAVLHRRRPPASHQALQA